MADTLPNKSSPAQIALLRYMECWSEENWAAGWISGCEHYMARDDDSGAFPWLIEQAGGWWTWKDGEQQFVVGDFADLEPAAQPLLRRALDA